MPHFARMPSSRLATETACWSWRISELLHRLVESNSCGSLGSWQTDQHELFDLSVLVLVLVINPGHPLTCANDIFGGSSKVMVKVRRRKMRNGFVFAIKMSSHPTEETRNNVGNSKKVYLTPGSYISIVGHMLHHCLGVNYIRCTVLTTTQCSVSLPRRCRLQALPHIRVYCLYFLPLATAYSSLSLLLQTALSTGNNLSFSGAFANLGKATISFVMSALQPVCLSVRMELGSRWMDFHEVWYLSTFRKCLENSGSTKIWQELRVLHMKTNIYCSLSSS